jgi:hypothetical protein
MKTSQLAEVIRQGDPTGMRSNHNASTSTNRSAGTKLGMPRLPIPQMPMPQMPVEWLDTGTWRLPSGKALAEFALQAGFLAPLLFRVERFGKNPGGAPRTVPGTSEVRSKNFGKGDGQ